MTSVEPHPHGPNLKEAFHDPPDWLISFWIISAVSLVFCIIRFYWHYRNLMTKTPASALRDHYVLISALPLVFCSTSFATLFACRPAYMFQLIRNLFESRCFDSFLHLLFILLGTDDSKIVARLAKEQPQYLLSSPPLGCFFRPCESPRHLSQRIARFVRVLTLQFIWAIPILSYIDLWILIDGSENDGHANSKEFHERASSSTSILETISMLIAMYGLFIMYRASHTALHLYHPTTKFVAIKLVIIVAQFQRLIVNAVVPSDPEGVDRKYDHTAKVAIWNSFLLAVESGFLAAVIDRAFPASELLNFHKEGPEGDKLSAENDGLVGDGHEAAPSEKLQAKTENGAAVNLDDIKTTNS